MPKIRKKAEPKKEFYKEHRAEYKALVKKANARWQNIEKNELSSPAVENAIASRGGKHYFKVSDFSGDNAMKELAALREFLADETSTVKGAKYYTDTVERVNEFQKVYGKPWESDENGNRFNNYRDYFSNLYGEEYTKRIYSNYRYLEEEYNELLNAGILGDSFDSETLITLLFDRAEQSKKKHFKERNWASAPERAYGKKILEQYDQKFFQKQQGSIMNDDELKIRRIEWEGKEVYDDYVAGQFYL